MKYYSAENEKFEPVDVEKETFCTDTETFKVTYPGGYASHGIRQHILDTYFDETLEGAKTKYNKQIFDKICWHQLEIEKLKKSLI